MSNIKKYLKIIDKIEKVRTKNNSNWIDILRLALKSSPNKAIKIMMQINEKDKKISSLLAKLNEKKKR